MIRFGNYYFVFLLFILSTGCVGLNDGFGGPGGFGGGGFAPSPTSSWEWERQRQLERERWELERERRRLEDERRRQELNDSYRPPIQRPIVPRVESCPNGYTPSEQKCSAEERRRGCKDMRLSGGLGCVKRSFR